MKELKIRLDRMTKSSTASFVWNNNKSGTRTAPSKIKENMINNIIVTITMF